MKNLAIFILIILVVVAISGSLSLACSKGSGTPTTQAGATAANTTAAGGNPTSTGATVPGAALPGGMPDIADLKYLPSYRLTITNKQAEGPGAGTSVIKYEWVLDQKAEHVRMEDGNGKVTMETISIGEKSWIWMGLAGLGWVEQPPQTKPASSMPSDLSNQLKQAQQDIKNSKARFDKKGTETVNNVRCTRYEFEYNLTTEMPNMATGGTTRTDMHSSGEVWIADQSGLPAVMIRSKSRGEITMANDKMVIDSEQNLTDIGAAISIKPPEGALRVTTGMPDIPGGIPGGMPTGIPTPPAGITRPPPINSTTPPKTTVTAAVTTTPTSAGSLPAFKDDFQGEWNNEWNWTDPNDDVTYDFTAHTGFLRLTAPDGNDLAGAMNFDAPRLLIPAEGDFTIETLIEFDPQEVYQGAGLLVWQDENGFLRTEFGYGGMGGEAKNVVLVTGEGGSLGLVGSVDLPDNLKRIELRVKRAGDRFTAWYRTGSGAWKEIGSVELLLDSAVEAGISQVTQYTSSEISADFDYFRMYKN
jgi:regulation of enolase protein 1 (concanavalin A-like superfamily)